jgi:hypothetical protein
MDWGDEEPGRISVFLIIDSPNSKAVSQASPKHIKCAKSTLRVRLELSRKCNGVLKLKKAMVINIVVFSSLL